MKHLKLYESFNPISWAKSKLGRINIPGYCSKLGIKKYKINDDNSVDVYGSVSLTDHLLEEMPMKFNSVDGSFYISRTLFSTLKGSPRIVGGDFYCDYNGIQSLEHSPVRVGGDFDCSTNFITDLSGCPEWVGGDFDCSDNSIYSSSVFPSHIGGDFICGGNPIHEIYKLFNDYKSFISSMDFGYMRGNKIIRSRFEEAMDEAGVEMPTSINHYIYI